MENSSGSKCSKCPMISNSAALNKRSHNYGDDANVIGVQNIWHRFLPSVFLQTRCHRPVLALLMQQPQVNKITNTGGQVNTNPSVRPTVTNAWSPIGLTQCQWSWQRLIQEPDQSQAHVTIGQRLQSQTDVDTGQRLQSQTDVTTGQRLQSQADVTTGQRLQSQTDVDTGHRLHP